MTKISKVIETLMETKNVLGDIDIDFPKAVKKPKDFSLVDEVRKFTDYDVFYSTPRKTSSCPQYLIQRIGTNVWSKRTHFIIKFFFRDVFIERQNISNYKSSLDKSIPSINAKENIEFVFENLKKTHGIILISKEVSLFRSKNILYYSFEVYA